MVYVRLIELPYKIKACTTLDVDCNYNIYINCRLDTFAQKKAYLHEMEHINKNHFNSEITAMEAESQNSF